MITPVPRTHRQSQIEEFTCFHSDYSKLKSSNSDSGSNNFPQSSEIGVRSFSSWKPRRNSTTFDNEALQTVACRATFVLNEDRVLDEMNVDTKRVIESKSGCGTYYRDRVGAQNPFKSDLYLRVLYLVMNLLWCRCDDLLRSGRRAPARRCTIPASRTNS